MNSENPFDLLEQFAEIEKLVSKIYFRFSHLFLQQPQLRDFWWEMAAEEDQHGAILLACKILLENCTEESLDPTLSREKAEELKTWLLAYFTRGTPSLGVEEAFRIALEIESSEVDTIYNRLLQSVGPNMAQTMESLAVPTSVQRQKLKLAVRQFCADPKLLAAAERL